MLCAAGECAISNLHSQRLSFLMSVELPDELYAFLFWLISFFFVDLTDQSISIRFIQYGEKVIVLQ